MSSLGRNLLKSIAGTLVGVGIAVAVSKALDRPDNAPPDGLPASAFPEDLEFGGSPSTTEKIKNIPERVKNRWQEAKEAGYQAQAEQEERLRQQFRQYVNDPTALPVEHRQYEPEA